MGTILLNPGTQTWPKTATAPIVETKALWSDEWTVRPEIAVEQASACVAGQDLGSCVLRRPYGTIKWPWETEFEAVEPIDLMGHWVRVRLMGESGLVDAWLGRVGGDTREIYGGDAGPTGIQTFTAYEPAWLLQRIHIHSSWWRETAMSETEAKELGWCPSMNDRDERRLLVGNRSAAKVDGTYVFGGTDTWTHRDALEYVVARFVDESTDGGPAWSIGGQVDLLEAITDAIPFEASQTAAELLRKIVPTTMGVDYDVRYTDDGFEVAVFALSATEYAFAGATLPANPDTVELAAESALDGDRIVVVRTQENRYNRIRVLGRRMVVCCSIRADASPVSLIPGWASDLETAYKAGTGSTADASDEHDEARRADSFRPVYRLFVVPTTWDFNGNSASPAFDSDGALITTSLRAESQRLVRKTLTWLPLREGWDYTGGEPVNRNATGIEADFLPPGAWLYDPTVSKHRACEELGIGVSVVHETLGIFLQASPNHLLALNHWTGSPEPTDVEPAYDYSTLVATVAFEHDWRLCLEYEVPDAGPLGGTLTIVDDGAELWYLAPGTCLGVDTAGKLVYPPDGRVLRNDAERLGLLMAGAIARYGSDRARAELHILDLLPWTGLLSRVLTVVESGGDTHAIGAPITGVEWQFGDRPRTVIRTGYAL